MPGCIRKTMADPMQDNGAHPCSRAYGKSGEDLELKDVISEESNCSSDSNRDTAENTQIQKRSEVLSLRGLYQKLSAVQWRKAFTLAVVVINCFLANGSVSLIATFFPTKVKT